MRRHGDEEPGKAFAWECGRPELYSSCMRQATAGSGHLQVFFSHPWPPGVPGQGGGSLFRWEAQILPLTPWPVLSIKLIVSVLCFPICEVGITCACLGGQSHVQKAFTQLKLPEMFRWQLPGFGGAASGHRMDTSG